MPEKILREVLEKVAVYNKKHGLICEGDRILVGLSGGADSVCLFTLLSELRKEMGFELRAVHVYHGIRPEAEEDVFYVKELCKKEDIFLRVFREDVPALSKAEGLTEEEAGRKVRYQDFQKALDEWKEEERCTETGRKEQSEDIREKQYKIAVAHHENDQAETILFQLFRGSGLSGLRGILPCRGNIIRPLLGLTKKEIEGYLKRKEILWCEDRTNASMEYSRNKIRHNILPYAEKEICQGTVEHIGKTAEILQEAEGYIKRQTTEAFEKAMMERGEACVLLDISRIAAEDIFIQKQVLLYGLEQVSEARKDIGSVHVEAILKLIRKEGNGELALPGKLVVRKSYQNLLILSEKGNRGETEISGLFMKGRGFLYGEPEPLLETEYIALSDTKKLKERFFIQNSSEIMTHIPEKRYTKWFDYDKIETSFQLRQRHSGDYLMMDDQMRRKSIKDYMIQEKLPASFRDKVWLLADGAHIMWVPGGRISAYYKVTEQTKTILQVRIKVQDGDDI